MVCAITCPLFCTNNAVINTPWYNLFINNNIPDSIALLPQYCSGFNVNFRNNQKVGLWALSPQVARYYGLSINNKVDERFDVQKSTDVAIRYLHDLFQIYQDWNVTILAFLDSPTHIGMLSQKNNIDIFNPNKHDLQLLYTKTLLKNKNIESRSVINIQSSLYDSISVIDSIYHHIGCKPITITNPIRLSVLCDSLHLQRAQFFKYNNKYLFTTEWLSASDQIYIPDNINPEHINILYESEKTFLDSQIMLAKQEEEARELALKKAIAEANATITYKVKPGDTLSHIAKKHHVSVKQLKQWNNIKSDIIQIGQKIKIKQL